MGALKKLPRPTSRKWATNIDIRLVDIVHLTPQVDLGRLVILVVKKKVSSGYIEAFALTTIALIAASFISNLSHLGSLPRRIPLVSTVLRGVLVEYQYNQVNRSYPL